jgi:hypothetical protein
MLKDVSERLFELDWIKLVDNRLVGVTSGEHNIGVEPSDRLKTSVQIVNSHKAMSGKNLLVRRLGSEGSRIWKNFTISKNGVSPTNWKNLNSLNLGIGDTFCLSAPPSLAEEGVAPSFPAPETG